MTDSTKLLEGWYVAHKGGHTVCIERTATGWRGFLGELPSDWTLGPRIADLMRDAARYRWIENHASVETARWHWIGPSQEDPLGTIIDAEIARERSDG